MTTRGRLLLVDDDEAACRLLAEVLQRDGHEVETALAVDQARITAGSVCIQGPASLEIDGTGIGRAFAMRAVGDPDGLLAALRVGA